MPFFYRVALTNPATEYDFYSHQRRKIPLRRDTPEARRLWTGVSVYSTTNAAAFTARRYPRIGKFIAALDIPEDGSIRYEQTTGDPEHYTLWADANDLLARVRSVVAV